MELLSALSPILIALAIAIVIAVAIRIARDRYLRTTTLTAEANRALQIEVTDSARRRSIQPGMEIDLTSEWTSRRIREPDQRAVLEPLLNSHVFGWLEKSTGSTFDDVAGAVIKAIWNPTRRHVVVSQWITTERESTTVIIERVLGSVVVGDQDNSVTHSHRAGGDIVEGDKIGRDKVGRDSMTDASQTISGDVSGSQIDGPELVSSRGIETAEELSVALLMLQRQAGVRGEDPATVAALKWAARSAVAMERPEPAELIKHERALSRASHWLRTGVAAIVEGASGALATHWVVSMLQG